jgi:hypothetical protein
LPNLLTWLSLETIGFGVNNIDAPTMAPSSKKFVSFHMVEHASNPGQQYERSPIPQQEYPGAQILGPQHCLMS